MMSSGRRWILIICLVVLLAAGVGIGVAVISGNHEAEKNAYIGISHLENGRGALAEDYLNRIGKWHGKKIQFVKDAAAALKEKMDGNNVLASIQSKQIQEAYSLNEKQQDVVEELQKYTATEAEMTETAGKIKQLLKIPEKRSKKYDAQYLLEYQAMESGRMRRTDRAAYAEIVSEEAAASLAMSAALSGGNYREAFQEAVQIVDKKPSAKNQLLLADIIAEGAHAGIYFTEVDLQQALGEDTSGSSSGMSKENTGDGCASFGGTGSATPSPSCSGMMISAPQKGQNSMESSTFFPHREQYIVVPPSGGGFIASTYFSAPHTPGPR